MANTDFSKLVPQIHPECHECPEILIINEIRNITREFCERSTYWRQDLAALSIVTDETSSGSGEYDLTIPTGAQIVSVINPIVHSNQPVSRRTREWLDEHYSDWRTATGEQSRWYRMSNPTRIKLIPRPTSVVANALHVSMALKPSPAATNMPEFVYNEWYEVISCGVLAKLLSMENETWYKPARAVMKQKMYLLGIEDATAKAIAEYSSDKVDRTRRVKPHFI